MEKLAKLLEVDVETAHCALMGYKSKMRQLSCEDGFKLQDQKWSSFCIPEFNVAKGTVQISASDLAAKDHTQNFMKLLEKLN